MAVFQRSTYVPAEFEKPAATHPRLHRGEDPRILLGLFKLRSRPSLSEGSLYITRIELSVTDKTPSFPGRGNKH